MKEKLERGGEAFFLLRKLHLDDWISARLKLSEINEGFAGKTVRSVIVFDA
jgi:S-(hydroxymethyl)glutathione dehydrogenase/alcohol dehydrogenase